MFLAFDILLIIQSLIDSSFLLFLPRCMSQTSHPNISTDMGELQNHTPNYGILTNSYPIGVGKRKMGYDFVRIP